MSGERNNGDFAQANWGELENARNVRDVTKGDTDVPPDFSGPGVRAAEAAHKTDARIEKHFSDTPSASTPAVEVSNKAALAIGAVQDEISKILGRSIVAGDDKRPGIKDYNYIVRTALRGDTVKANNLLARLRNRSEKALLAEGSRILGRSAHKRILAEQVRNKVLTQSEADALFDVWLLTAEVNSLNVFVNKMRKAEISDITALEMLEETHPMVESPAAIDLWTKMIGILKDQNVKE